MSKTRYRWFALMSVVVGLLAFWLGFPLGGHVEGIGHSAKIFYAILFFIDSLLLGAGISFIIVGLGKLTIIPSQYKTTAIANYISISWMLVSWYPHHLSHLLMKGGMNDLLIVEYVFHVTVIIASAVLGITFIKLINTIRV